jgi:hypothetical protein
VRLAPVASPMGFFVENKPKLGGTTDAIASSVRPIWDECCFYFPHPALSLLPSGVLRKERVYKEKICLPSFFIRPEGHIYLRFMV